MLDKKEKEHGEEGEREILLEEGNVELSERIKDTDKQQRRERIKESRYNREYERCVAEEIPESWGERVQEREKRWRD
jgi:hypothetical protein